MYLRAKEGVCLQELVKLAMPICQQAEQACPRMGPGRKPEVPDWAMALVIMVAVLQQKKTKSAQFRYMQSHRCELLRWLGIDRLPARSTYFERYRRAWQLYEVAIVLTGDQAVRCGWTDSRCVAVDQSLISARGSHWNEGQRKRGCLPRGADLDATWSKSKYHGWVQGYSYEVLVTTAKNGVVWPLCASAHTASTHPCHTFPQKIQQLPRDTKYVLADAEYDSNKFGEAIEYDLDDQRTGRRFLCPQIYRRGEARRPEQPKVEVGSRKIRRQRRDARAEFFQRPWAQNMYRRRSRKIEPYNSWLKSRFDLHHCVWHRGLENNKTQILAAIFSYQILLTYNHKHGRNNGQIQWILDSL